MTCKVCYARIDQEGRCECRIRFSEKEPYRRPVPVDAFDDRLKFLQEQCSSYGNYDEESRP